MYAQVEKSKENKSRTVVNSVAQKKSGVKQGDGFVDNRLTSRVIKSTLNTKCSGGRPEPEIRNKRSLGAMMNATGGVSQLTKDAHYLEKNISIKDRAQGDDMSTFNIHAEKICLSIDKARDKLIRAARLKDKIGASLNVKKKHQKSIKKAKCEITEGFGEANATNYMQSKFQNAQLLLGFAPGVGFDQVWRSMDGNIIIVEAKGAGATLGSSTAKGEQMSCEWVWKTANAMAQSDVRRSINEAIVNGTLKRFVVTSTQESYKPKSHEDLGGWDSNNYKALDFKP